MLRLISFLGLFAMIGLAWLMSTHKRKFPVRVVIGGLALQFLLAAFIFSERLGGRILFGWLDRMFVALINCVDVGAEFVFGEAFGEHYFAFKVLPTIIFFSAFMSIFYYYGVMQAIVGGMARVMQWTLGTSGAETLSAAANVFVGQTEAPLVVRPYIGLMTYSELNSLMVGGFATIAGGVLAAYVGMGISATHLLSASVISAPAALLIAKVMQPEVDQPKTLGRVEIHVEDPSQNVLEAFAAGAVSGLKLALNVGAMLIAFLALIAVINVLLGWGAAQYQAIGERLQWLAAGDPPNWSLEAILGWLFAPLALLMGIAREDCRAAGELLGLKMAANEFVAYAQLAEWTPALADGGHSEAVLSNRTREILTYALCGFANFSSIGIQLGGIGGIAPERRSDLAKLGFRAMLGGTLAAFMTACVAGVLL